VPNDGVDDADAIQAAINSLPSGGTVLFPPGTYHVSKPLVVRAHNLTLTGDAAILRVLHSQIALDFNLPNGHLSNLSITGHLTLEKDVRDWQPGSVGIRLRNGYHSRFRASR
jgi:hypothetical protein